MKLIQTSLIHKILPSRHGIGKRQPALIMLHGLGANEEDLFGLAEHLDERLFLISARAPFQYQWSGGFTWYDFMEGGKPDPDMFQESYRRLLQFLDDVKKGYPVEPSNVLFLGFSMGTIMSFCLALTKPDIVKTIIANSGYINLDTDLTYQWDKIDGSSFFIAHGTSDSLIPVGLARRTKELLEKTKARVTYKEYEMNHEISSESLYDMSRWITERIDKYFS